MAQGGSAKGGNGAAEVADVQAWTRSLDLVEQALIRAQGALEPGDMGALSAKVRDTRAAAEQARARAEEGLATSEGLLEALGPPPEAGHEADEPPEIRVQREQYQGDISTWRARKAEADLTITRANQLLERIVAQRRASLVETLLRPTPLPWMPDVLAIGVPDILHGTGRVIASPFEWVASRDFDDVRGQVLGVATLWALLAGVVGFTVRWAMLRRFGRREGGDPPGYARRVGGALAEGAANGVVPGLLLGGVIVWAVTNWDASSLFRTVVLSGLTGLLFIIMIGSFARAALAPGMYEWRLTGHDDRDARRLTRAMTLLGAVFAFDIFVQQVSVHVQPTPEGNAVFSALITLVEGLFILYLTRRDLWDEPYKAAQEEDDDDAPSADADGNDSASDDVDTRAGESAARGLLLLLRLAVILLTMGGMAAPLVGYGELGEFVIKRLLATGAVIGFALVLRGMIRDVIGLVVDWRLLTERVGYTRSTLKRVRFWLRAVLDPVLAVLVLGLIAPIWEVPPQEVIAGGVALLTGVSIGSVTISVVDIVLAIAVFLFAMTVTRIIQGTLQRRVFSHTRMDPGVRHSLTAGLGYLGVVIAAMLAVAAVGVDLTNIALIAGALSVGIGFGLQNIVNNFVSGLIILVERPIKVGDWVDINGSEGFVKRISFRATEIETWTMASVIMPNAEILSQPFTNMTHRDRLGRVDVKVRVAFGTDTRRVHDLLMEILRAHPQILALPAPFVIMQDFGEYALMFEMRGYTANVINKLIIASDLRMAVDRRFRAEGIDIPFPQRVLRMLPDDPVEDPGAPGGGGVEQ